MSPQENLRKFAEFVQNVPSDENSEEFVRDFLSGYARSCPMNLLVQLAQNVIDYRKSELKNEAERN